MSTDHQTPDELPDVLRDLRVVEHKPAARVPDSWHPVAIDELDAFTPPVPELLQVEGFAFGVRGERHVINGEPGSLKTWVAAITACQELERGGTVLWVNTDGMPNNQVTERLYALGCPRDAVHDRFILVSPHENPGAAAGWLLDEYRPTLLVVDSFEPTARLVGSDSWKPEGIEAMYEAVINPFHRAGIGTIIIDHQKRNAGKGDPYAPGSWRKFGITDQQVRCSPVGTERMRRGGGTTAIELVLFKDRNGAYQVGDGETLATITFTSDGAGGVSWGMEAGAPERGDWRPTGLMEAVSRYLEAEPAGSKNRIEQDVKGKAEHIRAALQVLINEGFVKPCAGVRKGVTGYESVTPYREAEDQAPGAHIGP